jgi:hypothetical protein
MASVPRGGWQLSTPTTLRHGKPQDLFAPGRDKFDYKVGMHARQWASFVDSIQS